LGIDRTIAGSARPTLKSRESIEMRRVILEGLVKRYDGVAVVDGASLELRPGEMTYVLGPSGAGKTTLARLVAGLEPPDDGEIFFDDQLVQAVPARERGVGMVFEDLGLWPGLTVVEHVGYPLKMQRHSRAERRRRVAETLTALRIDSLAGRRPEQLTPQQRLRTALARALVTEPELLILDAPLRSFDARTREECRDELRHVHGETGITTLAMTDDPDEALALSDALAVMDLGRIVQCGPARPNFIIARPTSSWRGCWAPPTCSRGRSRANRATIAARWSSARRWAG
jgi:ABC-type Fe3+/spermidine/putrescine transport system ATPase subunit